MSSVADFDPNRAWMRGPDVFKRFVAQVEAHRLADADLADGTEVIVVTRGGESHAFVM